jgi:SAM-dependent methyltransferase
MILKGAGAHTNGKVLDVGCGVGTYLKRLTTQAEQAFGVELDFERAKIASQQGLIITCSAGEDLPYPSNCFDLVLSHEVLEHVEDDRQCLEEIVRTLRRPDPESNSPGGRAVLFLPNRGYPFETHGLYWRGKYRFGNIPLINYLPRKIRNRLVPHVRIYSTPDLNKLIQDLPLRIVRQRLIYGAYDNIIARWPCIGRILRATLQALENTPLRIFGLSHFWVLERTN